MDLLSDSDSTINAHLINVNSNNSIFFFSYFFHSLDKKIFLFNYFLNLFFNFKQKSVTENAKGLTLLTAAIFIVGEVSGTGVLSLPL